MTRVKTGSTLGELSATGERAAAETLPIAHTLPDVQRRAWLDVEAWFNANPDQRGRHGSFAKAFAATGVARNNYDIARRKMEAAARNDPWHKTDFIRPGDKIISNVRRRVQDEEDAKSEREARIEKSYETIAKAAVPDELPAEVKRDIRIALDPAYAIDDGKCADCPETGSGSECSLANCPVLLVTAHPPAPPKVAPASDPLHESLETFHKIVAIVRPLDKATCRRVLRAVANMMGVDE